MAIDKEVARLHVDIAEKSNEQVRLEASVIVLTMTRNMGLGVVNVDESMEMIRKVANFIRPGADKVENVEA